MSNTGIAVQFEVLNDVDLTFYISNAGWELLKAGVTIENVTVGSFPPFSCPTVSKKNRTFQLRNVHKALHGVQSKPLIITYNMTGCCACYVELMHFLRTETKL